MASRKKILFVITKANWGGAQRYVYDIACGAQAGGYESVVAYGEPGLLATKLQGAGIRTVPVPSLGRDIAGGKDLRALRELRALLSKERPDVVHLNSSKAAGLGALAARLERVPRIIYTAHGWAFNETRPWYQKIALRMAAEATIYLAHETICVSQATKRDITPIAFAGHKLVVIHHGITCPTAPLAQSEARQALLPGHKDRRWIGMVSELHPTKRVEDAIAAFAQLEATDAILVVLGEGEERQRLENLIAERGLADRVFLLGFVADAPRYMPAFDIFLHTSQSETFGYVIAEAGCASLPVVATRVGGIPEIIEDDVSGVLVPARSPALIAIALEKLLDSPSYAERLGAYLHAKIIRGFSQAEMIRKTLAVYTK